MIFSIEEKRDTQTALYTVDRKVSYGELTEAVKRFGGQITGRNLVFCLCGNCIAAVTGYLGIINQGSVPLLLDVHMEWEQIRRLYEIYCPDMVWMPEENSREWKHEGRIVYAYEGYVLLEMSKGISQPEMNGKLALLLPTSGSTGSPKLVRLSKENILSNAAAIVEYLGITEDERAITSLPMHYTYGLSVLHSHLLVGAGIILTENSVVQEEFWQLLAAQKATSLSGVPYTYQMLDRLGMFETSASLSEGTEPPDASADSSGAMDSYIGFGSSIQTITQAGGKLPEALQIKIARWARARQVRFCIMYGQTEATARMGYLPEEAALDKVGSLGIAIPGGRFWLEDEAHQQIREPGTSGELYYQGPNVSLGYAQCRKDLSQGDERGGILATGDLARFDQDGYYYIVGRKSRFVKLYGHRISLDACERMLEDAWQKSRFGAMDGVKEPPQEPVEPSDERLSAVEFVCTGNDSRILIVTTKKELAEPARDWLTEQLNLPKRAVQGLWLPQIPRNSQGKIHYSEVEADGNTGN